MPRMGKTYAKLQVSDVLIPDGVNPWPRTVVTAPQTHVDGDVLLEVKFPNGTTRRLSMPARGRHIIDRPDQG